MNKDFGKISTAKANSANAKIEKIVDGSGSLDQKAREIEKVWADTYRGTGIDMTQAVNKNFIKKMLEKGEIPIVSDKRVM